MLGVITTQPKLDNCLINQLGCKRQLNSAYLPIYLSNGMGKIRLIILK